MGVVLEPEDISRIDIKYRERGENVYGYAVVYLKEPAEPVSVFHFTFSMSNNDFQHQVAKLEENAKEAGFQLNLQHKSRLALALEQLLVGALAGTGYRNRGCPSCRMIDTFISGGR